MRIKPCYYTYIYKQRRITMGKVKGFIGEYKYISKEYYSESTNTDTPASLNNKALKKVSENNYTNAISLFNQAIDSSNSESDVYIKTVYHNRGMAKIDSSVFDIALSLGFTIDSIEEFNDKLESLNKLIGLFSSRTEFFD